ncbi:MAG: cysteine-rich CWC family protein, partial [Bacteroidetes bacterium]|nr:cysteine-rich CWC family protein [Bacteroidota bacterium]
MAASVEKICPRCNIRFNCHAADIQNCPCSKIDFTEKERAQLQT